MNVLHIEVERRVEPDTLTYHLCHPLDISWITTSIYDKEIRCKIFTHTRAFVSMLIGGDVTSLKTLF